MSIGLVFCLLTPTQAAKAYSPIAFLKDGVPDEEVGFIYWQEIFDHQPITVSIYEGGTPDIDLPPSDPAIDEFEAMELAFAAWEEVLGVPISFNIQYTTTHELNGTDGENVIFFDDLGNVGYGGTTIITYDTNTGQILDADIHMNDHNISWFTSLNDVDGEPLEDLVTGTWKEGEFQNDIQGLAAHEIGHLLGLAHSAVGIRQSDTTPTMYPRGIWGVPGDGMRPANSYYRSLEIDDHTGIQEIYQPDCQVNNTGEISGMVNDLADEPLFGAHVVARDLSTQDEIGVLSGIVQGPYTAGAYVLRLPPGTYELRVEPVDGSPPGFVGPWNYGGVANSLTANKFPREMDLEVMYHRLVYDPAEATPITVAACTPRSLDFRPIAKVKELPRLVRMPQAFAIEGEVSVDVTGPLTAASLTYTVDDLNPTVTDLPLDGSAFAVPIEKLPSGSLLQYSIEVQTTLGETLVNVPDTLQVGLSGEPLVLLSKQGSWELGAVDTRTMFEIDAAAGGLVFPLGLAFHADYGGIYVANFGSDTLSFVPFWNGELLARDVRPFDTDGDGLLDLLEPSFGTSVTNPDSDGDRAMDGLEISEFRFIHPDAGPSSFEVVGGTVANDGLTPIGSPDLRIAVWDVTNGGWVTSSMKITPSGRFRLRLPADITYLVSYRYNRTRLINTSDFSGASGDVVDLGVTQVPLEPPAPVPADTGTDPLDPVSAPGLFLPGGWFDRTTFLESSADSWAVVLSPDGSRAYVTGSGTDKVYEIDTTSSQRAREVVVGQYPTGLAITPDGSRLYVVNHDSEDLTVLDVATLDPITTIPLPGAPWSVGMTADGVSAVVTIRDSMNLAFIDVATDSVDQTLDLGFNGLYFLSGRAPTDNQMVAGPFQSRTHELAMLDVPGRTGYTVDLGTDINATSGLALHPDGARGYAVHFFGVELLEFDVETGNVGRRYESDWIDIRDLLLVETSDLFPSLSIDDVSVLEGDAGTTNAVFTVSLSVASSLSVSVDFATSDGAATAGSDYNAASGTLTFPAGTTTQTVTVEVLGDPVDEVDETFFVHLINPTHVPIADPQGQGTIIDDDDLPIQVGMLSVTDHWQTVALDSGFTDPVVVAKPASLNGVDPTTVRLRNVTATSFDIRLQEWDYLNGTHGAEKVSFVALERGDWQLVGGVELEAGSVVLSNSLPGSDPFVPVSFATAFSSTPVVLSVVGSASETDAVVTRHQNVSASGFEVILQEAQNLGGHGEEIVYWVAWKAGTGSVDANEPLGGELAFEAGTLSGVTHDFSAISFQSQWNEAPCFLADMQTTNGADTANLRYRNLAAGNVEVQIDEEQSADAETSHNAAETVGYLAFDCSPAIAPFPEVGRLSVTHSWQTVPIQGNFSDPIVVAKPASLDGPDPTTVRLRNVTAASFDIRLQEWNYQNGIHGAEMVSYLVAERGSWRLPGGGAIEAGSLATANSRPGSDPFVEVLFGAPFPSTPVVFSVVGTDADGDAVATRNRGVSTGGFEVILQEEEALGGHDSAETIYWIAWQPGISGDGDPIAYEAGSQGGMTHSFTPIVFSSTFNAPPCFLADMQTFAGSDPSTLRYRSLSTSQVEVQVDDEQSADSETHHNAAETIGWVAFDCP